MKKSDVTGQNKPLRFEEMLKKFSQLQKAPPVVLPKKGVTAPLEPVTSVTPAPSADPCAAPSGPVVVCVGSGLKVRQADLPEGVLRQVMEQLTWENPMFDRLARAGKRDPRVTRMLTGYLEDGDDLVMARGFASEFMRILQAHRLQGKYVDETLKPESAAFSFKGELYGYQKSAIQEMGSKRFGILSGLIGSGKKVVAAYLVARSGLPALVVVQSKVQAYQWVEVARRFLGLPEDQIGVIGDGRAELDRPFTVGINRTLVRHADDMAQRAGYLIVDQCDRVHLNIFFKIVRQFKSAHMLGLAVTGRRKDGLNGLMAAYVGPVLHRIPMDRVRREARMVRPAFQGQKTAFDYPYAEDWHAMMKALAVDPDRNDLLATDILMATADRGARAVVLCQLLVHMDALVKVLEKRHRPAGTLSGGTTERQMERLKDDFDRGKIQVLCVTGQSLPLLDPKVITHLFVASPLRSPEILSQAVGLLLRQPPDKAVQVVDYQDMEMHLAGSYRGRCRIYRDMGVSGV